MKILLLNGSPRTKGNTAAALDEMEAVFAAEGLETERVQVGNRVIRGRIACGKCAEVCPSGAITQNPKGVWMISRKLCTGCGKCVEACPFGLIVKDEAVPYSSKCTACGICVKACPMELLEIVEK